MKKQSHYIFILMFVLITFSASRAQTPLRIGFQTGVNYANFYWPTDFGQLPKIGLTAAVNIEYKISSIIYLQSEARYIQKGFKFKGFVGTETGPDHIGEGTDHFNLNNLEFPILLKIIFNPGKIRPYLVLGPNLGINLSSTHTYTTRIFETGETDEVYSRNIDDVDLIEMGFEVGGGGELRLNKSFSITLTIRYAQSLSTVWEEGKSRGLFVIVGTFFKI